MFILESNVELIRDKVEDVSVQLNVFACMFPWSFCVVRVSRYFISPESSILSCREDKALHTVTRFAVIAVSIFPPSWLICSISCEVVIKAS